MTVNRFLTIFELVIINNINKRNIMKKVIKQLDRKRAFDGYANVWLPIEIHRSAKVRAAQEGITLKEMFAKAVNLYIQTNHIPQQ